MATTLAGLITSCRTFSGDGALDNLKRFENLNNAELGNVINGSNTAFYVSLAPVTPGGFQRIVVDNSPTTAYTPNEPLGEIVLATPPTTSVYATYYYYLFPDNVWTEIVTAAVQRVNLSTGNLTNDVGLIPEGMLAAVKVFANAFFCTKVASQTGLWYNKRLQERVDDQDNVSAKYSKMAEQNFKRGDAMLSQYYTDRNQVAAFNIVEHQPKPFTPSR